MAKPKRKVEFNQLPGVIFARLDENDRKMRVQRDVLAYLSEADAVDEDGPTEVATYQLIRVRLLKKKVVPSNDKS